MAAVDTKSKKVYLSRPPPKVYLQTINSHITCGICDGYLIDATTVDECLHSFCRSCLIQHIRTGTHCPVENCGTVINKVKPNIKLDTTLQAIVYKLVPGLYEKEILCRRAFYRLRKEEAQQATPEQRGDDTEHLIFGPNENISLMLEYSDNDSSYRCSDDENSDSGSSELKSTHQNSDDEIDSQLKMPKYLQCPAIFRISNLKKFVMHKFGIDPNKFCVEIMYKVKTIALPDYYTLMDVAYIYTWKRDAPMKFFYCVRAATKENVAVPNVDNLMRPSAEYINAKNAYIDSLRIRDTDHEQSSDADSDMRSESGVSSLAAAGTGAATTATSSGDVASTRAVNGNASSGNKHETEISTTTTTTTSRTKASTTTVSTKNTAPTTTTTMSTASTTTSNGSETNRSISQTQPDPTLPTRTSAEDNSDRTATNRLAAQSSEAVQRLSASPNQNNSPRNGSEKPTKTNGNDKTTDSASNSPSTSRSNFDVEMTKEKVKIKIINLKSDASSVKTASNAEPSGHPQSKSPAPTSPRSTSASKNDSIEPPAKSKFLLSKEKDMKAKRDSNPEAEYDFDQHLLEEKLTEKNQFLKSIHLAPRTAAEMQATKSPSKNEPKNDQPTDLSKDVKPSTPSVSTSSAPPTKNASPASTSPTARTSSPQTQTQPIDVDKDLLRRPEIKASKRKSREPVKNVTKLKCPPPTSSGSESNWSPSVSNNGGSRSPLPSSLLPSSSHLHNDRDRLSDAMTLKTALNMSQQNKINLNKSLFKQQQHHHHHQQRQSTFKTPTTSESSSSGSSKETNKCAESETSIIINNVQRPNQADTPRPSMAFNHNMSSFLFQPKHHQLFDGTEINEIKNDDAVNVKVYGPSMPSYDSQQLNAMRDELLKSQHMKNVAGTKRTYSRSNQNEPLHMNAPAFLPYHHPHSNQEVGKKIKPKSGHSSGSSSSNSSPGPIDMKKKLNSTGELEVITSSSSNKGNATPKRQSEPSSESVHTLLHNCNITLPSSLSVTLTNDEMESNRAIFNQKKTPVNNSIEIVKLPDESSSLGDQARYTKAQSNSPSLHSRSENNHSGSASPVAINLVNSKSTSSSHSQNAAKQKGGSSPVPGTSNTNSLEGFQAQFIQSVAKHAPMQLLKPKKKIFKPNPMLAPSSSYISMIDRSPPKRKPTLNGPKTSMHMPNRIPPRSPARKLLPPKIDSPLIGMPTAPSVSDLFSQLGASSLSERLLHANYFANHQSGSNRGGGGSGSSGMSSANKNSYLSIPTSSKPIWTDFATKTQKSAHVTLEEHLHKY